MAFAKTNEHFRLISRLDMFVITRATFFENFKALRLNLNEQREKKLFSVVIFYLTNRSVLMFHVNFVDISNTYIFHTELFFQYNNIFRFISEKHAFCNISIFFRIFSSQISSLKHMHFFSDGLSKIFVKRNAGL